MAGRASRCISGLAACLLAMPGLVMPCLVSPASAQTVDEPEIPDSEDEEERRRRDKAADDARDAFRDEGVTYRDILRDPDNIELNLRYARGQIARGELKGASATLERILLIQPDLPQVRLYYAIVLFRLDNSEEAERELLAIKELDLPPDIEREVDDYLSEIALRRERLRFTLGLSFGGFFDDNKTAGSKTDQQLVVGTLVDLAEDDIVHDDFGLLGVMSLDMAYDLGLQDKHQVIGSFSHYISEQATLETFNTQSLSVEGGLELNYPRFSFTPTAFTQSTFLSRERYFRGWGVGGKLNVPIDGALGLRFEGRYTNEKFNGIEESATAVLRSGHRHDYEAGVDYILNPANRLSLEYHQRFKRARREFYEYDANTIAASHTWLIGGGHYLLTSGSYEMRLYAGPDTAVSAERRKDRITQVRMTYGLPFSTVLGDLLFADAPSDPVFSTLVGGWTLNLSAEAYTQRSNLATYDYRNLRGQAIFSKRFQF